MADELDLARQYYADEAMRQYEESLKRNPLPFIDPYLPADIDRPTPPPKGPGPGMKIYNELRKPADPLDPKGSEYVGGPELAPGKGAFARGTENQRQIEKAKIRGKSKPESVEAAKWNAGLKEYGGDALEAMGAALDPLIGVPQAGVMKAREAAGVKDEKEMLADPGRRLWRPFEFARDRAKVAGKWFEENLASGKVQPDTAEPTDQFGRRVEPEWKKDELLKAVAESAGAIGSKDASAGEQFSGALSIPLALGLMFAQPGGSAKGAGAIGRTVNWAGDLARGAGKAAHKYAPDLAAVIDNLPSVAGELFPRTRKPLRSLYTGDVKPITAGAPAAGPAQTLPKADPTQLLGGEAAREAPSGGAARPAEPAAPPNIQEPPASVVYEKEKALDEALARPFEPTGDDYHHFTTPEARAGIEAEGFKTGGVGPWAGTKQGGTLGEGIYLANTDDARAHWGTSSSGATERIPTQVSKGARMLVIDSPNKLATEMRKVGLDPETAELGAIRDFAERVKQAGKYDGVDVRGFKNWKPGPTTDLAWTLGADQAIVWDARHARVAPKMSPEELLADLQKAAPEPTPPPPPGLDPRAAYEAEYAKLMDPDAAPTSLDLSKPLTFAERQAAEARRLMKEHGPAPGEIPLDETLTPGEIPEAPPASKLRETQARNRPPAPKKPGQPGPPQPPTPPPPNVPGAGASQVGTPGPPKPYSWEDAKNLWDKVKRFFTSPHLKSDFDRQRYGGASRSEISEGAAKALADAPTAAGPNIENHGKALAEVEKNPLAQEMIRDIVHLKGTPLNFFFGRLQTMVETAGPVGKRLWDKYGRDFRKNEGWHGNKTAEKFEESYRHDVVRDPGKRFEDAGGISQSKSGDQAFRHRPDGDRFLQRLNANFSKYLVEGNEVGERFIDDLEKFLNNPKLKKSQLREILKKKADQVETPASMEFARDVEMIPAAWRDPKTGKLHPVLEWDMLPGRANAGDDLIGLGRRQILSQAQRTEFVRHFGQRLEVDGKKLERPVVDQYLKEGGDKDLLERLFKGLHSDPEAGELGNGREWLQNYRYSTDAPYQLARVALSKALPAAQLSTTGMKSLGQFLQESLGPGGFKATIKGVGDWFSDIKGNKEEMARAGAMLDEHRAFNGKYAGAAAEAMKDYKGEFALTKAGANLITSRLNSWMADTQDGISFYTGRAKFDALAKQAQDRGKLKLWERSRLRRLEMPEEWIARLDGGLKGETPETIAKMKDQLGNRYAQMHQFRSNPRALRGRLENSLAWTSATMYQGYVAQTTKRLQDFATSVAEIWSAPGTKMEKMVAIKDAGQEAMTKLFGHAVSGEMVRGVDSFMRGGAGYTDFDPKKPEDWASRFAGNLIYSSFFGRLFMMEQLIHSKFKEATGKDPSPARNPRGYASVLSFPPIEYPYQAAKGAASVAKEGWDSIKVNPTSTMHNMGREAARQLTKLTVGQAPAAQGALRNPLSLMAGDAALSKMGVGRETGDTYQELLDYLGVKRYTDVIRPRMQDQAPAGAAEGIIRKAEGRKRPYNPEDATKRVIKKYGGGAESDATMDFYNRIIKQHGGRD